MLYAVIGVTSTYVVLPRLRSGDHRRDPADPAEADAVIADDQSLPRSPCERSQLPSDGSRDPGERHVARPFRGALRRRPWRSCRSSPATSSRWSGGPGTDAARRGWRHLRPCRSRRAPARRPRVATLFVAVGGLGVSIIVFALIDELPGVAPCAVPHDRRDGWHRIVVRSLSYHAPSCRRRIERASRQSSTCSSAPGTSRRVRERRRRQALRRRAGRERRAGRPRHARHHGHRRAPRATAAPTGPGQTPAVAARTRSRGRGGAARPSKRPRHSSAANSEPWPNRGMERPSASSNIVSRSSGTRMVSDIVVEIEHNLNGLAVDHSRWSDDDLVCTDPGPRARMKSDLPTRTDSQRTAFRRRTPAPDTTRASAITNMSPIPRAPVMNGCPATFA